MRQELINFPKQFEFKPDISNSSRLPKERSDFIICGMGGSHIAADLIKSVHPEMDIFIHSDYDLPRLSQDKLKKSLIVLSSYSGNTAEVISAGKSALRQDLNLAAIASGGKLLEWAIANNLPFIKLPAVASQPRFALGVSTLATLSILGLEKDIKTLKSFSRLNSSDLALAGEDLAKWIKEGVPLIYSSTNNSSLAYTWKTKLNETAKIPAFSGSLPEIAHNEVESFFAGAKKLTAPLKVLLLKDKSENKKINKIFAGLASELAIKKIPVRELSLNGKNKWQKIWLSLILADWTSFYIAKLSNIDPVSVPTIQSLKDQIK